MSPKDLNTLDILPQLIEAGVTSYKIEGRMKRPEYVAVVVDAYRRAIDSYLGGDYQVPEEDFANIEQIFNRDFQLLICWSGPAVAHHFPAGPLQQISRRRSAERQRRRAISFES